MKYVILRLASERQDSNLRLRAPKARTLTKLSYFPIIKYHPKDSNSPSKKNSAELPARQL